MARGTIPIAEEEQNQLLIFLVARKRVTGLCLSKEGCGLELIEKGDLHRKGLGSLMS